MFKYFYQKRLKDFLLKPFTSNTYSRKAEANGQIDQYQVLLFLDDNYSLQIYEVDEVYLYAQGEVRFLAEVQDVHRPVVKCAIKLNNVAWDRVRVIHHYRILNFETVSFKRKAFSSFLGFHYLKWFYLVHKMKRINFISDRYSILSILEQNSRNGKSQTSTELLLLTLYGPGIKPSFISDRLRARLRLVIDGLLEEKLIALDADYYIAYYARLLPRGLKVLDEYQKEMSRHADANRTANIMKIATVIIAMAAVIPLVRE